MNDLTLPAAQRTLGEATERNWVGMSYPLHELSYGGELIWRDRLGPWFRSWKNQLSFILSPKNIFFLDRWVMRPLLARSQMILQDRFLIHGSNLEEKDYDDITSLVEHGGYGAVWTVSQGIEEQTLSFTRSWSRIEPWSGGSYRAKEIAELSKVHFGVDPVHREKFFAFTAGDECRNGLMVARSPCSSTLLSASIGTRVEPPTDGSEGHT